MVVVMRPWRSTSVTSPRTSALRWSAGRPSRAIRLRCRMANTRAPFWGKAKTLLLCPQQPASVGEHCQGCCFGRSWG